MEIRQCKAKHGNTQSAGMTGFFKDNCSALEKQPLLMNKLLRASATFSDAPPQRPICIE